MTKAEVIAHAAREIGDTSADFVASILTPAFDLVLAELVQFECIDMRRVRTFEVLEGVRGYDLREVCQVGPHAPLDVVDVLVYGWGINGHVERLNDDSFADLRMTQGEAFQGYWQGWRVFPRPFNLEVQPPAGPDQAGVTAQVTYLADPAAVPANEDLVDLSSEDLAALVVGLKIHAAEFGEDTRQDLPRLTLIWDQAKRRMWGRRHNNRVGRIAPRSF